MAFTGRYIDGGEERFRIAEEGFRFRGGVRLTSRDPALHMISWFDGSLSSGMLRDGRAIVLWPSLFSRPLVNEVRVARTAELAGQETGGIGGRDTAPSHPEIPDYRYVTSARLVGTREYLGLWQPLRGREETLVVRFQPPPGSPHHLVIGRVPLRLNSLYVSMPLHGISWDITFTSEAPRGRPVYILHYLWMPSYFQPLRHPQDRR